MSSIWFRSVILWCNRILKVFHGQSVLLGVLYLAPGTLADIAADVDDIDFVGHVNLALVLISEYHVCNHHQRQEDDDPKAESAIFR